MIPNAKNLPHTSLSNLANILHYSFWILLFIVLPLYIDPSTFDIGFSGEKAVLLPKAFILGFTCTVGIFALLASYPEASFALLWRHVRRWPLVLQAMLGLSIFLLIDVWFAQGDLSVNLIGSRFRVDGFLVQAAWYALVPMAAGLIYAHAGRTQRPLRFLAVGALLSALWTLLQAYGLEPAVLLSSGSSLEGFNSERAAYGPTYITGLTAGYLAVVLTLWLILKQRFSLLMALGVALLVAALVATGNRTSLGALILMIAVIGGWYLWQRRYRRLKVLVSYLFMALLAVSILQVTRPGSFEQLERTTRLVEGEDGSWQLRVLFWRAALQGMFDAPLTGHGPNAFNEVFWRYTDPEETLWMVRRRIPDNAGDISQVVTGLFLYSLPDPESGQGLYRLTVDKAHNYLLDVAIAGGLPVLLLFVTAVSTGVWMLLRSPLRVARAIACSIIVYMLFGLTWFATVQVDPIVWGLFGVGIGAAWAQRDAEASSLPPSEPATTPSAELA